MAARSPDAFARQLRALSDERFVALVAAIWAARGWDVRVEGATVHCERGDRCHRIRVLPDRDLSVPANGDATAGADTLVARVPIDPAGGMRACGPEDLRNLLRYGLEETDSKRIGREYLEAASGPRERVHRGHNRLEQALAQAQMPALEWDRHRTGALAAGAVVALAAVVLVVGGLVPVAGTGGPGETTSTATPVSVPEGDGSGAVFDYPRGLDSDGITDPGALVDRHVRVLAATSYRCRVQTHQIDPMIVQLVREKRFVAASPRRYATSVTGSPPGRPDGIDWTRETYANGSVRFERLKGRTNVTVRRTRLNETGRDGPLVARLREPMTRRLAVNDTTLAAITEQNGTAYYRVRGTPASTEALTNRTLEVTVREDGVITEIQESYRIRDTEVTIIETVKCDGVGTTRVRPPDWVQRVRTADKTGR